VLQNADSKNECGLQYTFRAWSPPNASYVQKRYENRPMKIEDYEPGMSSLASREHHKVWRHYQTVIENSITLL